MAGLCRCAYTNWTTTATDCDDFFTDPNAIQLYKNHIRTILTRVNTVTGIKYGADPTIMGEFLSRSVLVDHACAVSCNIERSHWLSTSCTCESVQTAAALSAKKAACSVTCLLRAQA